MKPKLNKKILIVDDEDQLLDILVDQFEREGFTAIACKNGVQGIELAKQHLPDLMIIDVVMPEIDGLTMLQKLREDESTKNIPAIVLTNLSDPQTTADALKAGAFDHLVKTDWEVSDVIHRVKEKLGIG